MPQALCSGSLGWSENIFLRFPVEWVLLPTQGRPVNSALQTRLSLGWMHKFHILSLLFVLISPDLVMLVLEPWKTEAVLYSFLKSGHIYSSTNRDLFPWKENLKTLLTHFFAELLASCQTISNYFTSTSFPPFNNFNGNTVVTTSSKAEVFIDFFYWQGVAQFFTF